MKPSWEGIARVLEEETISDAELAYRLGCKKAFVARVRADLGQPPRPLPPIDSTLTIEQRFYKLAALRPGGHRAWLGRKTRDGVPLYDHFLTAARVAFRLTHGREPVGQVRVACLMKHCVEGFHLTDKTMRDAAEQPSRDHAEATRART